jgi:predicted  nucleic acid-binding Zn-ribbon protein
LEPQIDDLIALQKVDSNILDERALIAAVPDKVAAVDARIQDYKDKLDARNHDLDEAKKERRTLESELKGINDKLSKYQDQLMQVKTNDAYTAMLKEIEGTKKDIAQHEETILEDMLSMDEFSGEIKGLEKEFQADKSVLEKEKADVQTAGREAAGRLAQHEEERKRLASSFDRRTLAAYERVATMRAGLAVVEVREELCLGCRVKVRPQIFEEIRVGEGLRQCDSCTRFLFYVQGATLEDLKIKKQPAEQPADDPLEADPLPPDALPADKPTT